MKKYVLWGYVFVIVALVVLYSTLLFAQSQPTSISYTFQFNPPQQTNVGGGVGGCVPIDTENNNPAPKGDNVCFSATESSTLSGFSLYVSFPGYPGGQLILQDGNINYNGRAWDSETLNTNKAGCLYGYGPGSTFTDSWSNNFTDGNGNVTWSGPIKVKGLVTTTKVIVRGVCQSWEMVHTSGSGTETSAQ